MTLLFLLGTWPIAIILIAFTGITVRYGLKQSKSGTTTGGNYGNPIRKWKENMPYYKTTGGIASIILGVVTLAFFIWLITSK